MRTDRYRNLHHLTRLDPERDHHAIYRTTMLVEFPWLAHLGLNLAFYRTYGIPRIARVLASTGQITHHTRDRAQATGAVMFTLIEHGFDHPSGRAALRRLNLAHRGLRATHDDYLYVLGATLFVPLRWIARYGWRPLTDVETRAAHHFHVRLGRLMGLKGIPDSVEAFQRWFDDYETAHVAFTPEAQELMRASQRLLEDRVPRALRPVMRRVGPALLDPPLRQAVGVGSVARATELAVHAALRATALLQRTRPPRTRSVYAGGHGLPPVAPTSTPDD
nr:oxygenase MpaB family protein [Streptoalloteichus tenebrarius]